MESKKAYGFLFQISTKTNKKELAIKPLLFVYSLTTDHSKVILWNDPLFILKGWAIFNETSKSFFSIPRKDGRAERFSNCILILATRK